MNNRDHDCEDYDEPETEQSEWAEWRENDDARRNREFKSDNERPY